MEGILTRTHKIRLYPNNKQITYFQKACGVSRFAYNWALARSIEMYEQDNTVKFDAFALMREINSIKREQFPWMLEVTKCAPQEAIRVNLNTAYSKFFKNQAGFPKFHRKGRRDSFHISNTVFSLNSKSIRIPKLGWIRMAEELRFKGKILRATVSRTADKWFVSITVELPNPEFNPNSENQAIGVDLGVKTLATLSDGTVFQGPKATKKYEQKLRRLNQSLSRKTGSKKGEVKSANFRKAQMKLARLHAKIANSRNDCTHKATSQIASNYDIIGIEDLSVQDMAQGHKMAKSVLDMSFYEFRRQIEYKAEALDKRVVVANRFYPSSKTCSRCGEAKNDLSLSERVYICAFCGFSCDRDLNAAINLRQYALQESCR